LDAFPAVFQAEAEPSLEYTANKVSPTLIPRPIILGKNLAKDILKLHPHQVNPTSKKPKNPDSKPSLGILGPSFVRFRIYAATSASLSLQTSSGYEQLHDFGWSNIAIVFTASYLLIIWRYHLRPTYTSPTSSPDDPVLYMSHYHLYHLKDQHLGYPPIPQNFLQFCEISERNKNFVSNPDVLVNKFPFQKLQSEPV
jgi:hypothetical protein